MLKTVLDEDSKRVLMKYTPSEKDKTTVITHSCAKRFGLKFETEAIKIRFIEKFSEDPFVTDGKTLMCRKDSTPSERARGKVLSVAYGLALTKIDTSSVSLHTNKHRGFVYATVANAKKPCIFFEIGTIGTPIIPRTVAAGIEKLGLETLATEMVRAACEKRDAE